MKYTEKQIQKRQEIVQQVLQSRTGELNKLSVRMICGLVQISTGNFYHYFDSLDDFFNEALEGIEGHLEKYVAPFIHPEGNEKENLVILSRGYAGHVRGVGNAGIKSIKDFSYPLASTADELREEKHHLIYTLPYGIFKRGQEKEQFRTDIDAGIMTYFLQTIYRGLAIDWMRRNCYYDIEQRYAEDTGIYLNMISI